MAAEDYMIPCMNKKLFGVECFGCGIQRAIALLLKGEFAAAFHMFPAIYTTLMFFAVVGLHFLDKSRNYTKFIIGLAICNALIMIASYFYKVTH